MDILSTFKDIAPFLQHPLVLVGFVVLLFFGILTALLKSRILPPLPQKTAGDIVKRVINFGFIIAVLMIVLGFWENASDTHMRDTSSRGRSPDTTHRNEHDTSVVAHHSGEGDDRSGPEVYCRVTLMFPSEYNDADVFVDGRRADVVERKLNSVTIRIVKSEKSRSIVLRNSGGECTTREVVDGDRELRVCL